VFRRACITERHHGVLRSTSDAVDHDNIEDSKVLFPKLRSTGTEDPDGMAEDPQKWLEVASWTGINS
jgi:hypothetical protein